MSKAPSEKTQLVNARREIKELTFRCVELAKSSAEYRARATRAEQDVADWKMRFDKLLEFRKALRIPE
jgi:hypothetical protein